MDKKGFPLPQMHNDAAAFTKLSGGLPGEHYGIEGREKKEAMAHGLEVNTENLIKLVAETNLIEKTRRKASNAVKHKTFEDFIISVDNVIKFYGAENTCYQSIADSIMHGTNFLEKSFVVGDKFSIKQKLRNMVEFFTSQTQPTMEEKIKQLKGVVDELNIGRHFIHDKECALTGYIKHFQAQVKSAHDELESIKSTVDRHITFIRCIKQDLACHDHRFEAKCGEFKQKIANFEAGFYATVQNDVINLETYKKMLSFLRMQLKNGTLYFDDKIKVLENDILEMKNAARLRTNFMVSRNANVPPFPSTRNVYAPSFPANYNNTQNANVPAFPVNNNSQMHEQKPPDTTVDDDQNYYQLF
uniref:Uncharacterized protein n=1 Tax=Panagrolaimus sp. PS1159 TaxID=55785 RepID=A0AC35GXP1_9BILA